MAAHSSILPWRIPWTEEPCELQSMESQRVRHDWSELARGMWGYGRFSHILSQLFLKPTLWWVGQQRSCLAPDYTQEMGLTCNWQAAELALNWILHKVGEPSTNPRAHPFCSFLPHPGHQVDGSISNISGFLHIHTFPHSDSLATISFLLFANSQTFMKVPSMKLFWTLFSPYHPSRASFSFSWLSIKL